MQNEDGQRALRQLVIKPTVYCYHRCPYCDPRQDYYRDMVRDRKKELPLLNSPGRKSNPGHMSPDLAIRMIEEAAALGMEEMQLSGGDPLLYPHLIELIQAAKGHPGVFVFMNSVGTGVTVERARQLINAGLGAWNFSIDTLDATKYDQLRGVRNALPTILRAVETVREAGFDFPDFRINYLTVITRQNFRDIPSLVAHCIDTGVASIYLMNVCGDPSGASLLKEHEVREFREEVIPFILEILRVKSTPEIVQRNAANVLGTFFSLENPDSNYARGVYWPNMESVRSACQVPDYYSLIEPDGRVLPCCPVELSHEGEVGNVTEESLTDIWKGRKFNEFRRERIAFCQRCSSPRNRTLGLIPKMCRQFP